MIPNTEANDDHTDLFAMPLVAKDMGDLLSVTLRSSGAAAGGSSGGMLVPREIGCDLFSTSKGDSVQSGGNTSIPTTIACALLRTRN